MRRKNGNIMNINNNEPQNIIKIAIEYLYYFCCYLLNAQGQNYVENM